jgi:hypothetical protein
MSRPDDPVKRIEDALVLGFSLSEAVQKVLGRPLAAFARDHGYRQSEVSMCLGRYPGRVYAGIRSDLARELGIDRRELDRLIDLASATGEGGVKGVGLRGSS